MTPRRLGGAAAVPDVRQPGGDPARQQRRHPGVPLVGQGARPDVRGQPPRGRRRDRPARPRTARACCRTTARASATCLAATRPAATSRWPRSRTRTRVSARATPTISFFVSPYGFLTRSCWPSRRSSRSMSRRRARRRGHRADRCTAGCPTRSPARPRTSLLRAALDALVIEEMYRGTPVIYVDYTDYDEIAHHSGPERAERSTRSTASTGSRRSRRPSRDAPRPYRFVVLSDHGQTLGATFLQRYGKTLQDVVRELMGGGATVARRPAGSRSGAS